MAILGVCLLVIPSQVSAVNELPVDGSTETIDGVEYQVIYLMGDSDPEQSMVFFEQTQGGNYKFILLDDWDWSIRDIGSGFGGNVYPGNLIFDFNGHKITNSGSHQVYVNCSGTVELTDSSAVGGGGATIWETRFKTLVISGNCSPAVRNAVVAGRDDFSVIVRSAQKLDYRAYNYPYDANLTVAPYLTVTPQDANRCTVQPSHAAYAVTTTDKVRPETTAVANNLNAGQLASLVVPTAQPHYLWGRQADGAYEALDIVADNGEWSTFETIYLTADHDANLAQINARKTGRRGNYRYVLTADWTMATTTVTNIQFYGNVVILDLQGFTVTSTQYQFGSYASVFELTDTSATGTGTLTRTDSYFHLYGSPELRNNQVIISGGNSANLYVYMYQGDLFFYGGNYSRSPAVMVQCQDKATQTVTVAPWLSATYSNAGSLTAVSTGDEYVVSSSSTVAGVYNYEFGSIWGLRARDLPALFVPTNQTYYLWGRKADGGYEYLNIVYRDGEWVKVEPEISVA